MLIVAILIHSALMRDCLSSVDTKNVIWRKGDFETSVLTPELQQTAIMTLGNRELKRINSASIRYYGQKSKSSLYYYLAKVRYVGAKYEGGTPPGTSFSFDVDSKNTAYVVSYRLTAEQGNSQAVILLRSSIELRKVVSICNAAN